MSKEEILRLKPKRGIDLVFTPIHTNSNIYIVTISGTDLNPSNPLEELESSSEIDEIISNDLKVYSDRIRSPKELQKIPKVARHMAMDLNDKRLDSSKYDFLRSKATNKEKEENCDDCPTEEESGTFRTIQEG